MALIGENQAVPQKTLGQIFESAVEDFPGKEAIVDVRNGSTTMTFDNLNKRANKLARALLLKLQRAEPNHNPDGDQVVAVCMEPSSTLIVALVAILKVGAAYLPLDVSFPTSRVIGILKNARPSLVLVHGRPAVFKKAKEMTLESKIEVLHLEDFEIEVYMESDGNIPPEDPGKTSPTESTAAVLYTSGSTGVPSGVRIPHRAILNRLAWQWKAFPYSTDEVCCFKTALTFVDSISEIFAPLLTGHKVVIIPKSMTTDVDQLIEVLEREKVGRIVMVPTLLRSVLLYCSQSKEPHLSDLRLWICSGEAFPTDLLLSFFKIFTNNQIICNFYGTTEVMGDVTFMEFKSENDAREKLHDNKVPIGQSISNAEIYLLDSHQRIVEPGTVGEMYVGGMNLAKGYVGGALCERFIKNEHNCTSGYDVLYKTGDLARKVDSYLIFEGRNDSQLKIRGHRVDLLEIQEALQSVEGIHKCHVLAHHAGEVDQALVAYYTSANVSPDTAEKELAGLIPKYMMPQIIAIDELPLLVNGKVDNQTLLNMYAERFQGFQSTDFDVSDADPSDSVKAQTLLKTLAKVLGPACPRTLSLKDSFFSIGGNSLNSSLAVTSLKDCGFNVDVIEFLKAPNLKSVLTALKPCKKGVPAYMLKDEMSIEDKQREGIAEKYKIESLMEEHRCHIEAFSKVTSEKEMMSKSSRIRGEELEKGIGQVWEELIRQKASYIVRQIDNGEVVGLGLNYRHGTHMELKDISEGLTDFLTFLSEVEEEAKKKIPPDADKLLYSFLIAISEGVTPVENVELVMFMERENVRIAKEKMYDGLITSNTSVLTQDFCGDVLGYKSLSSCELGTWKNKKGEARFCHAPDKYRIVCMVRLF